MQKTKQLEVLDEDSMEIMEKIILSEDVIEEILDMLLKIRLSEKRFKDLKILFDKDDSDPKDFFVSTLKQSIEKSKDDNFDGEIVRRKRENLGTMVFRDSFCAGDEIGELSLSALRESIIVKLRPQTQGD